MTLLLIYGLVAIGISFLCSVLEAVLLSITPSFTHALKERNIKVGERIETLKERVDQPLAAILTLNTVAHTAGAAGVGAQAAAIYGDAAIGIASAVMTLLVLVLSEIIPKTLGANHWRSLAPTVSFILVVMVKMLKPFVWLSDQITKFFSQKATDHKHVRAEIEAMAMFGSQTGALHQQESEIIQGLMAFRHTPIRNIMTPRNKLFRVSKDLSVEEFCKQHGSSQFSRILVFDKDPDDIIGYVFKSDAILANVRVKPNYRLAKLTKPLYMVAENMTLPGLFTNMLAKRTHISLIIDEYGEVKGIVTLEDLLEALLQVHIFDEKDSSEVHVPESVKRWSNSQSEDDQLKYDDETRAELLANDDVENLVIDPSTDSDKDK